MSVKLAFKKIENNEITLEDLAKEKDFVYLGSSVIARDRRYITINGEAIERKYSFSRRLFNVKTFSHLNLAQLTRQLVTARMLNRVVKAQKNILTGQVNVEKYATFIAHIKGVLDYLIRNSKGRSGGHQEAFERILGYHQSTHDLLEGRVCNENDFTKAAAEKFEQLIFKRGDKVKKLTKQDISVLSQAVYDAKESDKKVAIVAENPKLYFVIRKLSNILKDNFEFGNLGYYCPLQQGWKVQAKVRLACDTKGSWTYKGELFRD